MMRIEPEAGEEGLLCIRRMTFAILRASEQIPSDSQFGCALRRCCQQVVRVGIILEHEIIGRHANHLRRTWLAMLCAQRIFGERLLRLLFMQQRKPKQKMSLRRIGSLCQDLPQSPVGSGIVAASEERAGLGEIKCRSSSRNTLRSSGWCRVCALGIGPGHKR